MSAPNCPFYGRHLYRSNSLIVDPPFLLLATGGNQCGLVTKSHSPCRMEMDREPVDWRECPLVGDARLEHE